MKYLFQDMQSETCVCNGYYWERATLRNEKWCCKRTLLFALLLMTQDLRSKREWRCCWRFVHFIHLFFYDSHCTEAEIFSLDKERCMIARVIMIEMKYDISWRTNSVKCLWHWSENLLRYSLLGCHFIPNEFFPSSTISYYFVISRNLR